MSDGIELRRSDFGDPMRILIRREEEEARRSCIGCAHARSVRSPFDDEVMRCSKGRPYGQKCHQYEAAKDE